jgi:lysyl endopeptidase
VTDRNGFAGTVNLSTSALPTGFTGGLSVGSVNVPPAGNSQLTLSADGSLTSGLSTITVTGVSGPITREFDVDVTVVNDTPAATTLSAPANGATDVSTNTSFSWDAIAGADGYLLEVATDAGFNNIVVSEVVGGTSSSQALASGTQHFWRVTASNACGGGVASGVFSFTTANEICVVPNPSAIPDNNPGGLVTNFSVANAGTILDLQVSLAATHTWVGDLIFTLTHVDTGTSVILMDRPGFTGTGFGCSGDNVDVLFSDDGTGPVEAACATNPAIGGTLIPQQALSAFDGQDLSGSWTLTASDNAGSDTGSMVEFCLLPVLDQAPNDIIFQDDFEL